MRHVYPALWLIEPASAFPEPQGRIPTGIFIACSQSGRSIRPLITWRPERQVNASYQTILFIFEQACILPTSCSRPSPETITTPSHSGSEISLISSRAWFCRSETQNYLSCDTGMFCTCNNYLVRPTASGVTCLDEVVANVGLLDHWKDLGLTPLHGLSSPTEGIH